MASRAHKTLVALFLSSQSKTLVQFAMAAASSTKSSKTLDKVLQELHHAYCGMKSNVRLLQAGKELVLDPILANYILANSQQTLRFFKTEMAAAKGYPLESTVFDSPCYTFKESLLTQELTEALPWATEILLYMQPAKQISDEWTWYAKVLSKDGYHAIHSHIKNRPRIETSYTTIDRARRQIPFP